VARLLPFALVGFLYSGLETAIGAWESTYLAWSGRRAAAATALTALYWAGLAAGRIFPPMLTARVRPAVIIVSGFAVTACAVALAVIPAASVFSFPVAGFALAPVLPALLAWMATIADSPQSANAIVLTACMAANAGYPAVVGLVADQHSPVRIPLALTGLAMASLLAARWLARRHGS
jgi:fucose permease